jgi:hypothetical protein
VQHREFIATAFRLGGLIIGIPSAVAFVYFGIGAAQLLLFKPTITPSGKTGNLLVDLFVSGASVVGKVFQFFGGAMEWVLTALSVVSFAFLAVAVLLYFTGRGLHASRGGARAIGLLLSLMVLLISFMGITSFRRPVPLVLSVVTFALSTYVVWALGWRFAG